MTEAATPAAPQAEPPKPAPPTEFPPPVRKTIFWLNDMFAEWYRRNPPPMPDRFTRREFGYILWPERPGTPPFIRHKAYDNADRFHWYLQKAGPHSVYYSTAYYRRPGEMKMLDKQWLGAELIFDLDADHLEDVEKAKAEGKELSLAEQLKQVKVEFKRLLDEYLFGDFGLGENDVWITFSGGRGYHAHVVQEKLLSLGSRERREIVDYVTGKFPVIPGTGKTDPKSFIRHEVVDVDKFGTRVKITKRERIAPENAPGWPGRITRSIVRNLEDNVLNADPSDARKWLTSFEGIGKQRAASFLEGFSREKLDRIRQGFLYQGDIVMHTLDYVVPATGVALGDSGETDEPVTADTKRLIRLPGSLHGKSGLKVVTLRRDDLDGFEPLRDAVAFPMEPTRILPRNDATMTLGGETVTVKKGEQQDVPLPHAVFWLARQGGTIVR